MSDKIGPRVKPGEWISVGTVECLIIDAESMNLATADIDVICNSDRPTVYGVRWDHDHWSFAHPMRGVYAEHHPKAGPFVDTLKAGRVGGKGHA